MPRTPPTQRPFYRRQIPCSPTFLCSLLLAACALLAACSAPPTARLLSVEVVAAADANHYAPIALDLVSVYDEAVLQRLPLSSAEWFEHRHRILDELGKAVAIVAVEIPPGATRSVPLPSAGTQPIAVFSYVGYASKPNLSRGRLTGSGTARIWFASDRISYESGR